MNKFDIANILITIAGYGFSLPVVLMVYDSFRSQTVFLPFKQLLLFVLCNCLMFASFIILELWLSFSSSCLGLFLWSFLVIMKLCFIRYKPVVKNIVV
jgi:hypothetical protein